ncbi:hypothetical protein AJ78_04791 [Emergomyces pasteurianus Ep9510]|uniref:Uncharacterized protein n=1 Tax=Emergomyces pasteurianus Ep9510 TaxID=1447872 RepID=A0A1J9PG76_9EURO|nr:hypothetical protein AJ78_04791 [Emergomyces pasteurianus Ep9510]
MAKRGYDWSSGQVYSDRIVPSFVYPSNTAGPSWSHESPHLPPGWEEGSPYGANSLKHMAMRKALLDQRQLTALHFSRFPWELSKYLWDCLGRCRKRTLHMWKIFTTVYPQEFREIAPHYSLKTLTKKMPLRDYYRLIHSPSLNWGTVFAISTESADLHGLVEISKITNLVALDITAPLPVKSTVNQYDDIPITNLTDRVFRSWGELAIAGVAFKSLRVLMLHLHTDITLRIFSYLDQFPSLEVLIIVGCPQLAVDVTKNVGQQHGWNTRRANATNKSIYECYTSYITSASSVGTGIPPEIRSLPLLEFSLAAPDAKEYKKKHKSIWLYRQAQISNAGGSNKKRINECESDGVTNNNVKRQRSKPVPKGQKSVNMANLLAEFQRFLYHSS